MFNKVLNTLFFNITIIYINLQFAENFEAFVF